MHFLVFQHVDVEHPGILREFWREAGIEWTAIELDAGEAIPDSLEQYDALVVMGGPMDVWQKDKHSWLVPEIAAIRKFAGDLGRPYLGVCLGHQLLAEALGGSVGMGAGSEIGNCPVRLTAAGLTDPLFRGLPTPLNTFQWHSAEVKTLPAGAVVLAETGLCPVQAFRCGPLAYGLQFHAEIIEETVDDWGRIAEYRQALENTLGVGASDRLAAETMELLPAYGETAAIFNRNFLELIGK